MMATPVKLTSHPHLSPQTPVIQRGLGLPLACGDWERFSISLSWTQYVCVDRKVNKALWLRSGPVVVFMCNTGAWLSTDCMCISTCVHTCIWPQPAEYSTACLFLLLLPAEGVCCGLGQLPSYVGWIVSTTLSIWCQRGSQLVPRPCFTTRPVSGGKKNCFELETQIFIYFLRGTWSLRSLREIDFHTFFLLLLSI